MGYPFAALTRGDDLVKSLVERLQRAVSEVDELRGAFMADPHVKRATATLRKSAERVGKEADELFEQMGRQTYDLIEKGKLQAPDPLRPYLEAIQRVVKPGEEPEGAEEPAPEPPKDAAPGEAGPDKAQPKQAAAKKAEPKKAAAKKAEPKKAAAKKAEPKKAAAKKAEPKKAAAKKAAPKKAAAKKAVPKKEQPDE